MMRKYKYVIDKVYECDALEFMDDPVPGYTFPFHVQFTHEDVWQFGHSYVASKFDTIDSYFCDYLFDKVHEQFESHVKNIILSEWSACGKVYNYKELDDEIKNRCWGYNEFRCLDFREDCARFCDENNEKCSFEYAVDWVITLLIEYLQHDGYSRNVSLKNEDASVELSGEKYILEIEDLLVPKSFVKCVWPKARDVGDDYLINRIYIEDDIIYCMRHQIGGYDGYLYEDMCKADFAEYVEPLTTD